MDPLPGAATRKPTGLIGGGGALLQTFDVERDGSPNRAFGAERGHGRAVDADFQRAGVARQQRQAGTIGDRESFSFPEQARDKKFARAAVAHLNPTVGLGPHLDARRFRRRHRRGRRCNRNRDLRGCGRDCGGRHGR